MWLPSQEFIVGFLLIQNGSVVVAIKIAISRLQYEDLRGQRMHPCIRELILTQVKLETSWDLDDIWCYKANGEGQFTVLIPGSKHFSKMPDRQQKRLVEIRAKESQEAIQAAENKEEYDRKVEEELQAIIREGKRDKEE